MPDTVRLARLDDAGHVVPEQWPPEVQQAVDAAAQVAADKAAAAGSASAAAASATTASSAATDALNAILPTLAPAGHTHQLESLPGILPVARGGTGSTSAGAALTALGAAPASHTHDAGAIATGTLPVARGGTGASTPAAALSALGAAAASHTHVLNDLSGTVAIAKGGTGATTAATALAALGGAAKAHVHSAGDITSGTLAAARLGDVPHANITNPDRVLSFGSSASGWSTSDKDGNSFGSTIDVWGPWKAPVIVSRRGTSASDVTFNSKGGLADTLVVTLNPQYRPKRTITTTFRYAATDGGQYGGFCTIGSDGAVKIISGAPNTTIRASDTTWSVVIDAPYLDY